MRQPNATKLAKRLHAYMSSPDYEGGDGPATALGKIEGAIRAEYCDLEVEVSRLPERKQIGWYCPGTKRFIYSDEKEAWPDRRTEYTVPVFIEAAEAGGK